MKKVLNFQGGFRLNASVSVRVGDEEALAESCVRNVPKLVRSKMKNKRCLVPIINKGQLCVARALVRREPLQVATRLSTENFEELRNHKTLQRNNLIYRARLT